ncbi:hypothetical protein NSU_pLA1152 (plasmid) [Novosphingobium pentaromativorans US6-1]|uniref:Uncharacterized protein n=1 Tax=Novosphingobium pentaromativorans US6-1 TaxID=1088721 RepID=G6EL79_9SPHN|nr:hypothetical protein NSU_pLA1152 [Novosphingobium pentaromativorans US6-1]
MSFRPFRANAAASGFHWPGKEAFAIARREELLGTVVSDKAE